MTTAAERTAAKIARAEAAAAALINAGETNKAKAKEANELLGRAYEAIRDTHQDRVRAEEYAAAGKPEDYASAEWAAYIAGMNARELPFDLHQVRAAKHQAAAESTGTWTQIEALANLRAEVKALPVVTRAAKGPTAEETIKARVLKSFADVLADRRAQFDWAKAIMAAAEEVKPGVRLLPVSVRHVYCMNEYGTQWIRVDWYLKGERTPFNIIAAAADATR